MPLIIISAVLFVILSVLQTNKLMMYSVSLSKKEVRHPYKITFTNSGTWTIHTLLCDLSF